MHLDRQQRQGQDAQDFFNLANIFLKTSGLRDGTRKFYGGYLQVFLDRISCNIRDITIEHLEAISLQVHKIKKTPAAYNNFVVVVKSFFSWLAKNGYCSNIGTVLQVIPRIQKQRRKITKEEYDIVVHAPLSQKRKDCFVFLCHTGLRASEFVGLTRVNIQGDFIRFIKKGGGQGTAPINKTVREIITRDPDLSFISGKTIYWLNWLCKEIGKTAGIPKFHPHSLRHYYANRLHKKKVDLKTISMALNHKNLMTTEAVYIEWKQEDELRGVSDVLDGD